MKSTSQLVKEFKSSISATHNNNETGGKVMLNQESLKVIENEIDIENKIKNLSCECVELYNKGFIRGAWRCSESQKKWYKNNGEINRLKKISAENAINAMKKSAKE